MMKYLRLLLVSLANATGFADNASLPGEVTTPFPAITNLDVEWQIEGDDDLRLANLSILCRVCAAERNTPMRIRRKPWCVALRCTHPTGVADSQTGQPWMTTWTRCTVFVSGSKARSNGS